MSQSNEQISSRISREVFFRPERKRVRDFMPRGATPELVVSQREVRLFDISANGLSFLCSRPEDFENDADLPVSLQLHGKHLFQGRGRVARREADGRSTRVGLALTSGFFDLQEMSRQAEEASFDRELVQGLDASRYKVPVAYRDALSELVAFALYYRHALERRDRRPRSYANPEHSTADVVERAHAVMRERWDELVKKTALAALECRRDAQSLRAAKDLTQSSLTSLLMSSKVIERAFRKPRGYPGDYQFMLHCHGYDLKEASVFGQVMDKLFAEHPLVSGVRQRCYLIEERMEQEHERKLSMGARSFRVASLGCGPSLESSLFAARRANWPGAVHWTLIDQDEEALDVAFRNTNAALAQSRSDGHVRCLNLTFSQLVAEGTGWQFLDQEDFIFSTGLFDYIQESRGKQLILNMYERLAPGGLLAIVNAVGPNDNLWLPEFVMEWRLLYRDRQEMLRLAGALPATADVEVVLEKSQAFYVLLIRKTA